MTIKSEVKMHSPNQAQSQARDRPVQLNPKKLLLTKWTAVKVIAKQKHFLVSRVLQPEELNLPITEIEMEAVYSGNKQIIAWRELQDSERWKQGWL
jgi:tryptophan-rich hypothetical protein